MRGSIGTYWVHTHWTGNVFLWLLLNWWILYRWRNHESWTFFLFLFVLLSHVIAFLLSVLFLPDSLETGGDLKHRLFRNSHCFFALAALLPPIDALDTLLKGTAHFQAQGPIYVVTMALLFVLCVIGAVTKSERFHAAFAVFFLFYIMPFITINLRVWA